MNSRPGNRSAVSVAPAVSRLNSILDDIDYNKDSVAVAVDIGESKINQSQDQIDDSNSRKRKIDPSTCWTRHFDDTKKADFYYNSATGERQWERPESYIEVAATIVNQIQEQKQSDYHPISHIDSSSSSSSQMSYYQRMTDRESRQLGAYFDISQLETNREQAREKKKELLTTKMDWKKYKVERKKVRDKIKNRWLYEDEDEDH